MYLFPQDPLITQASVRGTLKHLNAAKREFTTAVKVAARGIAGLDKGELSAETRKDFAAGQIERLAETGHRLSGVFVPYGTQNWLIGEAVDGMERAKSAIDIEARLWAGFYPVVTAVEQRVKDYCNDLN